MTALDGLTVDDFTPTRGQSYALDLDGQGTLDLVLLEASALGDGGPDGARLPFSILFVGPSQPQLPQRTYAVEHATLGRLLLFLVPVARDEDGVRYEAVFG